MPQNISAFVSILGMMLAMPNMIGFGEGFGIGIIFEWYGVTAILFLLLIAASTSLVFVSILSILSAYAKTVKEATAYASPIMIVFILFGFASAIFGEVPEEVYSYLIPVLNSSLSFSSIISFEESIVNLAVTALSNTVFAVAMAFVIAKMFGSEKIIFENKAVTKRKNCTKETAFTQRTRSHGGVFHTQWTVLSC